MSTKAKIRLLRSAVESHEDALPRSAPDAAVIDDPDAYWQAWLNMLFVCREGIQDGVDFDNRCRWDEDHRRHADKVNKLWDLFQLLMDYGDSAIDADTLDEIMAMPDPLYYEYVVDGQSRTMGHRAVDLFFPLFNMSPSDVKYHNTEAYQRFLWYFSDGDDGIPPDG